MSLNCPFFYLISCWWAQMNYSILVFFLSFDIPKNHFSNKQWLLCKSDRFWRQNSLSLSKLEDFCRENICIYYMYICMYKYPYHWYPAAEPNFPKFHMSNFLIHQLQRIVWSRRPPKCSGWDMYIFVDSFELRLEELCVCSRNGKK